MAQQKTEGKEKKKKRSLYRTRELHIMLIPAVLFTTFFAYLPIFGLVMAFQDFKPLISLRRLTAVPVYLYHAQLPDGFRKYHDHFLFQDHSEYSRSHDTVADVK